MEHSVMIESEIKPKMHFSGKVLRTSLAGALVDIGQAQPAMLHISQIVAPEGETIKRVPDVLKEGQEIDVWVKKVTRKDEVERVEVTMFQPLDLEWRDIKKGMTVKGKVVRLEKFGAFIEIGAERPGLVHISEMAHGYVREPSDILKTGDEIEAQVIDFNRHKRQIKLSIKALQPEPVKEEIPAPAPRPETPRREKPIRKKKPGRDHSDGDYAVLQAMEENVPQEVEATAMEVAMREAMDKAKTRKRQNEEKARRAKSGGSSEQEEILSRTLGSRPNA
jgi:predicted RNA-binding protein with RPS1 domain